MPAFGVDGCHGGWFFTRQHSTSITFGVVPRLSNLIEIAPEGSNIFVDIPIGLRDTDGEGRVCDLEARRLLGPKRGSSVFPAPLRAILETGDYKTTAAQNMALSGTGLSRQAFGIIPKVLEVDNLLGGCERARAMVREVHPELCFWAYAGGASMRYRKKTIEGFEERMEILEEVLPGSNEIAQKALARYRRKKVAQDDIADALVALATATSGAAALRTVPAIPERDSRGLSMEMVFNSERVKTAL